MDDDRRRDPRQPAEHLKARVRFADRKQLQRCYLKDISRGGIFLRTAKAGPLEAPIEVTLELPGGHEIKLNGTVVHRVTAAEARTGQPSGMGVQFTDLTPLVRRTLEALLDELSSPTLAAGPPVAEPAAPAPPDRSLSPEFEDRKTDPRGVRKPASSALLPDAPIIEEGFEEVESGPVAPPAPGPAVLARIRPVAVAVAPAPALAEPAPAPPRPARAPTPMGVRAAPAAGPSKATLESLRRLVWLLADAERVAGQSYYDLIGVDPDASLIEIRAACEALRRAFDLEHPPAGLPPDATARAAALLAALDTLEQVLTDPRRRAAYDRERSGSARP